jgi:formate hydrogenlyase subunit 4
MTDSPVFRILVLGPPFLAAGALAFEAADRRLTARMESRRGAEWLQPLYDLIKLAAKFRPRTEPPAALGESLPALAGLSCAAAFGLVVWQAVLFPGAGFRGDFFLAVGLLAACSLPPARPAALRSGRFPLSLAFDLPLFAAAGVPFLRFGGTFRMGDALRLQDLHGMTVLSASGAVAFLAAFAAALGKLNIAPFDAPALSPVRAESHRRPWGPGLAARLLAAWMLRFTLPAMIALLFLGGLRPWRLGIPAFAAKTAGLFLVMVFLRNTGPGLKPSLAAKWQLGPVTAAAAAAVLLALLGA